MIGLIFISNQTNTLYLWNGSDVICIRSSEAVHINTPIDYFKKVDFKLMYKNCTKPKMKDGAGFSVSGQKYKVLQRIKLERFEPSKMNLIIEF